MPGLRLFVQDVYLPSVDRFLIVPPWLSLLVVLSAKCCENLRFCSNRTQIFCTNWTVSKLIWHLSALWRQYKAVNSNQNRCQTHNLSRSNFVVATTIKSNANTMKVYHSHSHFIEIKYTVWTNFQRFSRKTIEMF